MARRIGRHRSVGIDEQTLLVQCPQLLGEPRKQASRRLNISYKALLNKLKKWQAEERPRDS